MNTSGANKMNKAIIVLVAIIVFFSTWACIEGIFSTQPTGPSEFRSAYGEVIELQAKGLYFRDSLIAASQGIAQDYFTLFIAIPLLLLSTYLYGKGLLKGKIMLIGLMAYFLYTYVSYAFLWQYNRFFLIYVILMSVSLYGFILAAIDLNREVVKNAYRKELPIKFIGGLQIFIGAIIGMMWIGRIRSGNMTTPPVGLEHYTTLVIQAMDLGFVVPTAVLSGILLLKKSSWGYWLSSIVIFKGSALLCAITGMIIMQYLNGISMSFAEIAIFESLNVLCLIALGFLLFYLDEPKKI